MMSIPFNKWIFRKLCGVSILFFFNTSLHASIKETDSSKTQAPGRKISLAISNITNKNLGIFIISETQKKSNSIWGILASPGVITSYSNPEVSEAGPEKTINLSYEVPAELLVGIEKKEIENLQVTVFIAPNEQIEHVNKLADFSIRGNEKKFTAALEKLTKRITLNITPSFSLGIKGQERVINWQKTFKIQVADDGISSATFSR